MPEARVPTHNWFKKPNHVRMAKEDLTKAEILDSGLARIPGWIGYGDGLPTVDSTSIKADTTSTKADEG